MLCLPQEPPPVPDGPLLVPHAGYGRPPPVGPTGKSERLTVPSWQTGSFFVFVPDAFWVSVVLVGFRSINTFSEGICSPRVWFSCIFVLVWTVKDGETKAGRVKHGSIWRKTWTSFGRHPLTHFQCIVGCCWCDLVRPPSSKRSFRYFWKQPSRIA